MLEKGVHHVTQDSWVQYGFSYATSVQQVFSKSTGSKPGRNLAYTLRQAFFVAAGGLAVETKSFHKEPYLTVTPTGAVELARLGLLTPVPEDESMIKLRRTSSQNWWFVCKRDGSSFSVWLG